MSSTPISESPAATNFDGSKHSNEATFRLLVESVQDYAIFRLDKNGIITTWNLGAQRLKGYTAEEAIGQHFSIFYPPEQIKRGWPGEELRQALTAGRYGEEGWRVRKDGSSFWASIVISVIRDASGEVTGFAKVTRDMTDRRRLEELEASSRRMSEFLATLGHELRNPLAPIRNAVGVLNQQKALDFELVRRTSVLLDRQVTHMTRLVDDLLDAGRITTGKIRIAMAPVKIQDVIEAALEASRPLVDCKAHVFEVQIPSEPIYVQADLTRLIQVVTNLLDNACKYTPPGGRIRLEGFTEQRSVAIRVADTGRGIDPQCLNSIFDLFVQEKDRLGMKDEGGLGIGLTLARSLVEMHSGRIEVQSEGKGRGSVFTVWLPAVVHKAEPAQREEPADDAEGHVLKILVVDDNKDSADSMSLLLQMRGHIARIAYCGADAIDVARQLQPDLVLLDLSMPGITGFEALPRIREVVRNEQLVAAAMSGFGQEEDKQRTQAVGFDMHLTKPVFSPELDSVIAAVITRIYEGRA